MEGRRNLEPWEREKKASATGVDAAMLALETNPFMSDEDKVLLRRVRQTSKGSNNNDNDDDRDKNGDSSSGGGMGGGGGQKKLPFDPRFQRGPWDAKGKPPRSDLLMPTLRPVKQEEAPPIGQTFDQAEEAEALRELP